MLGVNDLHHTGPERMPEQPDRVVHIKSQPSPYISSGCGSVHVYKHCVHTVLRLMRFTLGCFAVIRFFFVLFFSFSVKEEISENENKASYHESD